MQITDQTFWIILFVKLNKAFPFFEGVFSLASLSPFFSFPWVWVGQSGVCINTIYNQVPAQNQDWPLPTRPLSHGQNTILPKTPIERRKNPVKGWVRTSLWETVMSSRERHCELKRSRQTELQRVVFCLLSNAWLFLTWSPSSKTFDESKDIPQKSISFECAN